ncbi:hypothetical protein AMECASPLE_020108 [Ameca splendens]|uniref:Uncharacterized protein n=1 Tax=Ameca splendens TaxID=208324 RepID=A0ABV0XG73_9TELE
MYQRKQTGSGSRAFSNPPCFFVFFLFVFLMTQLFFFFFITMVGRHLLDNIHSFHPFNSAFRADADGCGQEGSPVEVCLTAHLKKPLTEDTLLLHDSLMKRMLRVLHNVPHFMKHPSLHNDLQRMPKESPEQSQPSSLAC